MKRLCIALSVVMVLLLSCSLAAAATVTIPVQVDKGLKNDGIVDHALTLQYVWDIDEHWESLFGFDITGILCLEDIQSIQSIAFHAHEVLTYYTGNNVHVYAANTDEWAEGVYTYGAYGPSMGSLFYPAGAAVSGGDPVDRWHVYDVTAAKDSLLDNGKLGLYLAMPTKDDWHNYAFHRIEIGTAFLTIEFDPAPGAVISGTVFGSDGITPVTGTEIWVHAYKGDPCGEVEWQGAAEINQVDGTYVISDLFCGDYYLATATQGGYLDEWWASSASSPDCSAAQPIPLATSETATGKDFQLDAAGTISGRVTDLSANPLVGIHVDAVDNKCNGIWYGAVTDESGNYTISVPEGAYYVRANGAASQQNYIVQWWDNGAGTSDCNLAAPVTATADQPAENINFGLAPGGFVSGRVTDAQANPIANLHLFAMSSACGGNWLGGTDTDENGDYQLAGMPGGEIYVTACGWCSRLPYVSEWYNNATDCNLATPVPVTVEQVTENIDFSLEQGGIISGRVADLADQPLSMITIDVVDHKCNGNWYGAATDPNGEYGVVVPPGDYYVRAYASPFHQNYLLEWWDGGNGTPDCNLAAPVAAVVGQPTGNIDFALGPGGSVSGKVTDADGNGIANLHMAAHSQACGGNWLGGTETDQNGDYRIAGLPQGDNYIHACGSCSGLSYVDEWYNNVINCNEASPVSVAVGQDTPNIDFSLTQGGTIEGRVTDLSGHGLPNVCVTAFANRCWQDWSGSGQTDAEGNYSFQAPAGDYYVVTHAACQGPSVYVDEWWNGAQGTVNCNNAVAVTVVAGETTGDIDFALQEGGMLSGTVTSDTSGEPIEGVQICAWPFPGGPGACTMSQPDGRYALNGVMPGYLRVQASGGGYLTEFYDNAYDPNWATAVWAAQGQPTAGIDFSMGTAGSISGTIYQSDGVTPLPFACVGAYMHPCGNRYAGAHADANGNYTIPALPPGDYYVETKACCTHPYHYVNEWWTSAGGALVCDQAEGVTVASGQDTAGVNFSLAPSEAVYPGPGFNWANVFSAHLANGTIQTIFVASITGPSPEDVAALTVTGPSGTHRLFMNETPFRQLGNFYSAGLDLVAPDGTYTFTVIDSLGRIATVEREFTYDSTLPQVAANTMKVNGMGDYAYVETATPTLTWDPVEWPGAPGYYQTFVFDYDGRAIWYHEDTEGTTLQVPSGFLQPDTAYYWWVRTCDIPETGERGQNRRYSEIRYFYTGTKDTPDLGNPNNRLLSYFTPVNGWANWFGITRTNLAPWDIGLYSVAGPEGTVYNYNGHVYMFWHPMFYHCWSPGPAPTPEGTYAFDLQDLQGNGAELNKDFVYNPAAPIPEATRFPAANAYAYTATPTFSWSAPAVEAGETEDPITYYYNLRIYDYYSRVHWYSSPTITETSFTLPEEVVRSAPPGSYKWEIRVYSDSTHDNAVFSSQRTVTLPPLSRYEYALPTGTGDPMDYKLFTVPLYMESGAGLFKALEEQLGPYDPPTHWRIFGYDLTRSGDYIEINSADFATLDIEPGMAFWIISVFADKSVQLEGAPAPQTTYYERKLHPGWNLFSLPWPATDIDLGNIAVTDGVNTYWLISGSNNLTLPYIWGFDREYVLLEDAGDVVEAGKGFWIKVSASSPRMVKVLIPPDNNGGHFPVDGGPEIILPSVTTYELPPPPPGGYPAVPTPDIKANGQDGTVTVPSGTRVSVAIGLDPGEQAGQWADWWVAAHTPFGWFSYVHPNGWQPGIHWAAQAPLFGISPLFDVLNMVLPAGPYTFYFAVDNNMDGNPDATYVDSVEVRVE